ncbi:glycoside hydrolase family 88 protein [Patescibacteria group bacterium]|nr:glycoside hydrolase family 88 protein [Patescibacteria group bacterium]
MSPSKKPDLEQRLKEVNRPANNIAQDLSSFIYTTLSEAESGVFPRSVKCDPQQGTCRTEFSTEAPYLSFAILSLKDSGNDLYRKRADELMNIVLEGCMSDVGYCDRNFFAMHEYYLSTGEDKYKEGMMTFGESSLEEKDVLTLMGSNIPAKWSSLYLVTKDERYKDSLLSLAEKFLNNEFQAVVQTPEIYRSGTTVVYEGMPEMIWGVMLPAYALTQDKRYLEYATYFFDNSNIQNHVYDIWLKRNGSTDVIKSIDALMQISELDKERAFEYRAYAKKMLEVILFNYWDTPERNIINGDKGIYTHVFEKSLNLQGWLILQINKFNEEPFTVWVRSE